MTKADAMAYLEKMVPLLLEIEEPVQKDQIQAMSQCVIFLLQTHQAHSPLTGDALKEARLSLASFAHMATRYAVADLRQRQSTASAVDLAVKWVKTDDKWREEHQ